MTLLYSIIELILLFNIVYLFTQLFYEGIVFTFLTLY